MQYKGTVSFSPHFSDPAEMCQKQSTKQDNMVTMC